MNPKCDHCGQLILPGEPHEPIPDGLIESGPLAGATVQSCCAVKMTEKEVAQ